MRDLPGDPAAFEQAAGLAGPDATVQAVRELAGGTHARTWLVRTANPELEVVIREFPAGDESARGEARVLTALDGLDGLAPRLLASDPDRGDGGGSWVAISRLSGAADITPDQPSAWATQLGTVLARVHATSPRRLAGLQRVLDRPSGSAAGLSGPAAGPVAAGWELLAGAPAVLTHHDYWSGNVVWADGVLTGVVDWTGGGVGPAGFDVGWCRLDLYLLYDEAVAGIFLEAYEAARGAALPGRLLSDLWAVARSDKIVETWVPNYRDLGRGDLTAQRLRDRHTAWTEHLLSRQ